MSLLDGLLPGLRDLRAPLAAGYLWLFTAWLIAASRLPKTIEEASFPLREVYELRAGAGPVGVAAAASFAAYLVGILSIAVWAAIGHRFSVLITWLALKIMDLGTRAFTAQWRRVRGKRGHAIMSSAATFGNQLWALHRALDDRVHVGRWRRVAARNLAVAVLTRRYVTDKPFKEAVLSLYAQDPEFKRTAMAFAVNGRRGGVLRERRDSLIRSLPGVRWADDDISAYAPTLDEEWDRLVEAAEYSEEVAEFLVRTAFDHAERAVGWTMDLQRDIELAPGPLAVSAPAAYDRWDRLYAEAEFRLALVPPLAALLILLTERHWLSTPVAFLGATLIAVLFVLGLQKSRMAENQLQAAIESRVIASPALDRLTGGPGLFDIARGSIEDK